MNEVNKVGKFRKEDDVLLTSLVNQHSHILENKQNNNNVKNGKKCAWAKIHTLFNASQTNGERTEKKLKKRWENLKQKQRESTTAKRQSKIKTGGGEKDESDDDEETLDHVNSVIQNRAKPLQNSYDGDDSTDGYESLNIPLHVNDSSNEVVIHEVIVQDVVLVEEKEEARAEAGAEPWRTRNRPTKRQADELIEENKSKKLSTAEVSRANYNIKLRTLAIAEKQDQRQEVIFDLEVEKRRLELDLIRAKIEAQNRLGKE